MERVTKQMVDGSRLTHATLRKMSERIGIGTIHQPTMRPQRGHLIQLTIERDVRGAGGGWVWQGNEGAFWRRSMVMRRRADDSAGTTAPTPIAPGRTASDSWLCPNMIAIGAGLA